MALLVSLKLITVVPPPVVWLLVTTTSPCASICPPTKLIPLVPSAAHEPGNVVVGVLVNRANIAVLDLVGKQILELTHGTAITISSNVDESTRAMLIVIHKDYLDEVETLLGQRDVSRLRLPPELGAGLPDARVCTPTAAVATAAFMN